MFLCFFSFCFFWYCDTELPTEMIQAELYTANPCAGGSALWKPFGDQYPATPDTLFWNRIIHTDWGRRFHCGVFDLTWSLSTDYICFSPEVLHISAQTPAPVAKQSLLSRGKKRLFGLSWCSSFYGIAWARQLSWDIQFMATVGW